MPNSSARRRPFQVAKEAIQIHGGYGYMEEHEMERFSRDTKLLEIRGGTIYYCKDASGNIRRKKP